MHTIKYTSITHCYNGNYQTDPISIEYFEHWCLINDALWAKLFDENTGELVAEFTKEKGLVIK